VILLYFFFIEIVINYKTLLTKIKKIFIKTKFNKPQLFTQLSTGAVEWAREFSWDKSANEMMREIDKIVYR